MIAKVELFLPSHCYSTTLHVSQLRKEEYNRVNSERLNNPTGIDPERKFEEKFLCEISKVFCWTHIFETFLRFAIVLGIEPTKRLFEKSLEGSEFANITVSGCGYMV